MNAEYVEHPTYTWRRYRVVIPRYTWLGWIGDSCVWYDPDTGFMVRLLDGDRITRWNDAGKLYSQFDSKGNLRVEPPWLWGATNQAEPYPPAWVYDDSLFEGKKVPFHWGVTEGAEK